MEDKEEKTESVHSLIAEIRDNTKRAEVRGRIALLENDIEKEAGKLPLTLLLAVPTVFTTFLPLVFDYGSRGVGTDHVAALASTFFVVFFVLPVMLLVFRAYAIGYGVFFLYAILFAATTFAVQELEAGWLRALAILVSAVVFAFGPQAVVSGSAVRAARRTRERLVAERAARKQRASGAAGEKKPRTVNFRAIERRANVRRPSAPLGLLAVLAAIGTVLVSNAPSRSDAIGWHPGPAFLSADTASLRRYHDTFSLVPLVDDAETWSRKVKELRSRDADLVGYLASRGSSAHEAVLTPRRALVRDGDSLFRQVLVLDTGSVGTLQDQWKRDTARWSSAIRRAARVRDSIFGQVSAGPPLDSALAALLVLRRSTQDSVFDEIAGTLPKIQAGRGMPDQRRRVLLDSLEQLIGILQARQAGYAAEVLAADDQLILQQTAIFTGINTFAQTRLAQALNNVRIVGVWIFSAALLILATTLAVGTVRTAGDRAPTGPIRERITARLVWFQRREGRRKGTYVLGCALLTLFIPPLLKKIEPEKMDVSRPFTPFTLPTWYLPAFARETVGGQDAANRGGAVSLRGGGGVQVIRDSTSVIFRDTTRLDSIGALVDSIVKQHMDESQNGVVARVNTRVEDVRQQVKGLRGRVDTMSQQIYRSKP